MKKLTTLTLLLLIAGSVLAQRPPWAGGGGRKAPTGPVSYGKISGVLTDSAAGTILAYASVSLFDPAKKKVINGTLTDENGRFKMSNIKTGKYMIKASFLGYDEWNKSIQTTPEKPDLDLGKLQLISKGVQLDEVEITAEASLIENKIDRIVYNADQDVTNVGGDASDVLRKVPLLSVDLEGNVQLRGSSNLQVLINGKPSGMFSQNIADALKMIPAEEIKSVEVITVPGAKYDAEGSGGIINIITRKKSIEGVSGSISTSAGTRNGNGNLSLAFARGRFGMNANGSYRAAWPREGTNSFFREDIIDGQSRVLEQNGATVSDWNGFGGRFGMFYDFNAFNSLTSNFNYRGRFSSRDANVVSTFVDPILSLNQAYNQVQETFGLFSGYDWNTDFIRTTNKKGQEFSIGVQVSGNINNQDYTLVRTSADPTLLLNEESVNRGNNLELTFQTDYVHPFSDKFKLEAGAKTILRQIGSDYRYDTLSRAENRFLEDLLRSNEFGYDQDVYAGYSQITWNFLPKWSLVAGARYEHTEIAADFMQGEEPFTNVYDNLLPSFIISRKLKGFSNLKLSFTQRLQRPSLFFINPFVNAADPRNVTVGNPELDPELSDQYELSYNNILKGGIVINLSAFYRRTTDVIEQILDVQDDGVTVARYQNIGENQSLGFDFFGSIKPVKIWTLRGGFSLFSYDASGIINGQEVTNTALLWNANLNSSFQLPKNWSIEFFGFFRSPRQTLQGSRTSFYFYNAGIKKTLWKKKGSLGLSIVQPFQRTLRFDNDAVGENFTQMTSFETPFRSFNFNFSYRFGKLESRNRNRNRNRINNNDQKSGESNNF
ncbi:MAG: TonB-dependent receptor [Bacteroidota bacterium]